MFTYAVVEGISLSNRNRAYRFAAIECYFAVAAIAAGSAFVAEMVAARVFRAIHTYPRRFFFADTAGKRHDSVHLFVRETGCFVESTGCFERIARQRWASLSTS